MKKITKITATTLAMCSMLTVVASATFTDESKIDMSNKYAVNRLVDYKIIAGNEDGTFAPDKAVTRAEMAKMIATMLNGNKDMEIFEAPFKDTKGHWSEVYIGYCFEKGIIAGKSKTEFAPDSPVTGVEAAKMLLIALGMDATKAGLTGEEWGQKSTYYANVFGLTYDIDENINDPLTRENAAQMISNTLSAEKAEYVPKTDESDGKYIESGVYLEDSLGYKDVQTNMPRYIYNEITNAKLISSNMWGQTNQIKDLYNITDEVEFAHVSITPMSPGIDEVFIAKVNDGKMDEVLKILEERIVVLQEQKAFYPQDRETANRAKIYKQGDYIMLYVSAQEESYDKVEDLFKKLAK